MYQLTQKIVSKPLDEFTEVTFTVTLMFLSEMRDSNPRPSRCKRDATKPTELISDFKNFVRWPRSSHQLFRGLMLSQSYTKPVRLNIQGRTGFDFIHNI